MTVIDLPRIFERPRYLVLAFMAGLSVAAGRSSRLYVDALAAELCSGEGNGAEA